MSYTQTKNCNLGDSSSGAVVYYAVLDASGNVVIPRTNGGVTEVAPGMFSATVSIPDHFHGQILWDTGTSFARTYRAIEQLNWEEANPNVDAILNNTQALVDIEYGRWQIVNNQMVFYKPDNVTVIARFNLFDDAGNPTMDAVFDRHRV